MRTVFADATYWIALNSPKDELHDHAMQASRELGNCRLLTSDLILTELLNHFARFGPEIRGNIVEFTYRLRKTKNLTIEPMSTRLFLDALDFYDKHRDKEWGLIDCASFYLMQQQGIREALTFDSDFEQAGFVTLLRRT